VVIATGNEDGPIGYPATLPDVLAVGASNPWDERKSPTTRDGEDWWGSNYGPQISLVAPGVRIATTDIRGARGYNSGSYVEDFNGTSSATPHVAAAAALILSVKPTLRENEVRNFITAAADRLTSNGKWDKFVGWGRLNIFSALRMARR
jgi:subtilisin family serine protease